MEFCDEDNASFPETEFIRYSSYLIHVVPAHPADLVAQGGHTTSGLSVTVAARRDAVGAQWYVDGGSPAVGEGDAPWAPDQMPAPDLGDQP